jgi:hypothetical protein
LPPSALGRTNPTEPARAPESPEIPPKSSDLIQLVYVSTAAPGLTADDLDAIAAASAARNAAAGITGLLIHQGDVFSGTLEGPERRVLARMEVIIRDPRHSRVRVLREAPISCRRFENWSFGSLPEAGDGTDRGEGFSLRLAFGLR